MRRTTCCRRVADERAGLEVLERAGAVPGALVVGVEQSPSALKPIPPGERMPLAGGCILPSGVIFRPSRGTGLRW